MPDGAEGARVTLVIGKNNENHILSNFLEICGRQTYGCGVLWGRGKDKWIENKNINIATDTY